MIKEFLLFLSSYAKKSSLSSIFSLSNLELYLILLFLTSNPISNRWSLSFEFCLISFIKLSSKYKGVNNLILVTHGTLMRTIFPSYKIDQGGMIVADKDLNFIGSIEIQYDFTY